MERQYGGNSQNPNTMHVGNNYAQGKTLYTSNSKRLMKEQMNRLNINTGGHEMEIEEEENLNQSSKTNPNDMAFIEFSTIEDSMINNNSPSNMCILEGLDEDQRQFNIKGMQREESKEDGLFTQLNNLLDDSMAMPESDFYIESKSDNLDFFDENIVLENVDKSELFSGLSEYISLTENDMYVNKHMMTQNNVQSMTVFKQLLGVLSSNYDERDKNQRMLYLIRELERSHSINNKARDRVLMKYPDIKPFFNMLRTKKESF